MAGPGALPRLGPSELVQMAAVARRFYVDGESKVQIGHDLGLSRFKIARMLEEARERGLVRIEISLPAEIDSELSDELRSRLGLQHAVVVNAGAESEASLREQLGAIAAELLTEIVSDTDVLGVGWGRTVNAVAAALREVAPCTVAQLSGALTGERVDDSSVEVARRVASLAGGRVYPIYAPLVVPDAVTAQGLRQQPQVQAALDRHRSVTKAFVAVGSWNPPNSQLLAAMDNQERAQLLEAGVCAEVCGTLIDEFGAEVPTALRERIISIESEELRAVPEVVAVAGGESKAVAIRAAIRGGYVSGLVTDAGVARFLLEGH